MPDGSWKREGEPEMMVYQDSAQLNFPKEKMVSCYADHRQIAKLRRGESGAYPDVKRAIKQALLRVAEEQVNVGLPRLQLQPEVKSVGDERSKHSEDYFKGSVPEPSPVPAGESSLDDPQSQGSSIPEPPEETTEVLHDKDVVSALGTPTSDDRENGSKVQNRQAISDPTITSASTAVMSPDDDELPGGDTEALKASIPCATDRWDTLTSPRGKESLGRPISRAARTPSRSELCSASQEGDIEKVRSLLAQGSSIHESSENLVDCDKDAFLLAALYGRLEVLKLLIQHNCDVSKRDLNGCTALHLICFDPETKPKHVIESLVILLLDHGVPLEAKDSGRVTALLLSVYNGKISIAECLLDYGANIHCADNDGYTALHHAARKDHHETVSLLILNGANIHAADKNGWTALHHAARTDHHETVSLLISKGADISSTDDDGSTALHEAARMDYHETVALLISKGAPLEARTIATSFTALHRSCMADGVSGESARLLLEAGADKEATCSLMSMRALHLAAHKGNIEVLNELLAFGVEIDVGDSDNRCALHWAKLMGQWRNIEALLAKGANPLLRDKYRDRPSQSVWRSDPYISLEDKKKCLKLLHDAEKVWEERKRREKEEARRKRKESGGSRFSRLFGKINQTRGVETGPIQEGSSSSPPAGLERA